MEHGARRPTRPWRAQVAVMAVLALAGLLFTVSATLARDAGERHPQDLAALVEIESDRVENLQAEVDALQDTVQELAEAQTEIGDDPMLTTGARQDAVAAGAVPLRGPGLTVTLDDAPVGTPLGPEVSADSLVVHQQDLEAVINALWAGGAEAMMLQDQRVVTTTAFRCVGNVLSLHGRVYSPPYTVQAIGDPATLEQAVLGDAEVQKYLTWVDAVGLGWGVSRADELELPSRSAPLSHARVGAQVSVPGDS
jgi:uncharacterized protein YlxW (UPF0749 family)